MDLAYLWFWIVGFLFVGYFVLDGFDFGVGMSLPFLGKDDISRRQIINTIGPVWDLNETWVIVAGACLFAAFPEWYATLFSGFYLALLLILLALILRGVSFEYRHQRDSLRWKKGFDAMIVIGSAVPALLWGVAFANIVQGVPLDADHEFTGSLLTLLNPYGLLGGLTTLLLFFTHGVYFVALKTDGQVHADARRLARRSGCSPWSSPPRSSSGRSSSPPVTARRSWRWSSRRRARRRDAHHVARVQPARPRGLGLRVRSRHDRLRGAHPVVRAVPVRHAVLDRHREQPDDRERVEHRLHAHDHDVGGGHLPAARAGLPGLDVLGLPQARHPLAHREGG